MIIKITNAQSFRTMQATVSKDEERQYLTGVYIEPDGTVTGTDGHILLTGKVAESFEGESFIAKIKTLPVRAVTAEVDTDRKVLTCIDKKGVEFDYFCFMLVEGIYPDYNQGIPDCDRISSGIESVGFVTSTLLKLTKAMPKHAVFQMSFGDRSTDGISISIPSMPELRGVLMPARI